VNVTGIILEQIDWDGNSHLLKYSPDPLDELWVAYLDEYLEAATGPFHFLESRHRDKFSEELSNMTVRQAGGFQTGQKGAVYETSFTGIPTKRAFLSLYALYLPEDAAPDEVEFWDPMSPEQRFGFRGLYDQSSRRVVCYLECKSRHASFNFSLRARFHRDSVACRKYDHRSLGENSKDIDVAHLIAQDAKSRRILKQFHNSPTIVEAGEGSIVFVHSDIQHSNVVGGVQGKIGAIGDNAKGVVETLSLEELSADQRKELIKELAAFGRAASPDMQPFVDAAIDGVLEDKNEVAIGAFRRLGKKGLDIAQSIGLGLVSSVISKYLGI